MRDIYHAREILSHLHDSMHVCCWLLFFAIQFCYHVWSGGPMGAALPPNAVQRSLIPFFIAAAVYLLSLVVQYARPALEFPSVHALPCAAFALRELYLLFSALFCASHPK